MLSFQDPINRGIRIGGDRTAIICGEERFSYRELGDRLRHFAGLIDSLGLEPGDRVAIVASNCHRYVETYLAVPANGLVLVPLNTRSTDAEILFALTDAGVRLLITDRPEASYESAVEHVLRIPEEYEEHLARAPERDFLLAPREDDLAGLFYTGGTTGRAKGVMLTHGNLIANALTALSWARLAEDDAWLVMSPMFHAAGTCLVLASIWMASRQVMLPSFEPEAALRAIEAHGATATLAVPTMLMAMQRVLTGSHIEVSSLRLLSHGASPAPVEVLRRSAEVFPQAELLHLYGTTETAPIATIFPHEEHHLFDDLAGSIGVPAIGVEVMVADEDGRPLPPGHAGEFWIRGNNVTKGYWNLPEQTATALAGGWYHTGDVGYAAESGYLFIVDRLKDMVVTGGENVYTIEVEDALYRHPAVKEAAVFGIPDPTWGEAVHAVVVSDENLEEHVLRDYLRPLIASYKIPKRIEVRRTPLPKSGAGKILKRDLREPFWEGKQTRVGN